MTEIKHGTVKWFNARRGIGFIFLDGETDAEGNPAEIFVHYTNIDQEGFKTLKRNQPVTFEIGPGIKEDSVEAKHVHPRAKFTPESVENPG